MSKRKNNKNTTNIKELIMAIILLICISIVGYFNSDIQEVSRNNRSK